MCDMRSKKDWRKVNWHLLVIYAKMVSEITIIIGFFIIFFLILRRNGLV